MPGFLYFLPGISRMAPLPSQAVIAERGLAYAFEGRPHGRGCNGPAGLEGFLLGCRRRFAGAGEIYFETTQIWRPHPSGTYWVGYWPDRLPGPAELARDKMLAGHSLELADDRAWQVPLARAVHDACTGSAFAYQWSCELPQRVAMDAKGEWVDQGPLPRYQTLWELVTGWNDYRRIAGDDDSPHRRELERWNLFQTRIDAAVQVLATNYVLGPVECSILGLFTREKAAEVLDLAIDEPEMQAIVKKFLAALRAAQPTAADAGSTSTAGPAVETIPTPPPSQI